MSATAAWWTSADQAEADVLAAAFVDGFYEHRGRCAVCSAGGPWCGYAREALELVLAWRRRRGLLSRAQALRREQDELALILDGRPPASEAA